MLITCFPSMATLAFFNTFLFLFFVLPKITANECPESKCDNSFDSPAVRFPFRLTDLQPPGCEYSTDFDLSCNQQRQPILTLPCGDFIVQDINYIGQTLSINDVNNCTARRFLDNDFNLVGSSFQFFTLRTYTFFNCSAQAQILEKYQPITCLSNENYKVVALREWLYFPLSCRMISTAMVPSYDPEFRPENGVRVKWDTPDCLYCELRRGVCGLASNLQLKCSNVPTRNHGHGLTDLAKVLLIVGLLGICLAIYIVSFIRKRFPRNQEPNTELTPAITNQPLVVVSGLDDSTIESYPKTQLGEKWEFPTANDSICAICLCEYQPKETLRSIPECNHHFHADCVEEWLRKNQTCPVCRKYPPQDNKTLAP